MKKEHEPVHKQHESVLVSEVLDALRVSELARFKKTPKFIDATLGLGGHALEIIELGGNVLGIEADTGSLKIAQKRLEEALLRNSYGGSQNCPPHLKHNKVGFFKLVQGNFKDIGKIAKGFKFVNVDGILFDLGISSFEIAKSGRGFSFQKIHEPLDMRFDHIGQKVTAEDLLKVLNKRQLNQLFEDILPPFKTKRLVQRILRVRSREKIGTVGDFVRLVTPLFSEKSKLNPATLAFLALRIAVNSEIENLKKALPEAFELLKTDGKLVVISFHSGEDKIVKNLFRKWVESKIAKSLTSKPIVPNEHEIAKNQRARSAKMRVIKKL